MVELVDTLALGANAEKCESSSLSEVTVDIFVPRLMIYKTNINLYGKNGKEIPLHL